MATCVPFTFFSCEDDSSEVGEEDSFLGQTTSTAPQPSTFSYFSSTTNSSDPFATIGHSQGLPPAPAVVPSSGPSPVSSAASLPPNPPTTHVNPTQQFGNAVYQSPMSTHTPKANVAAPPPPQTTQQAYNPYRHTATSSRASPYLMAPELQQQHPVQPPQHLNPYSQAPPAATFQTTPPTFAKVGFLICEVFY